MILDNSVDLDSIRKVVKLSEAQVFSFFCLFAVVKLSNAAFLLTKNISQFNEAGHFLGFM